MVYFRDLTSVSPKSQYLVISDYKDSEVETKLLVGTPLGGQYAAPWPALKGFPDFDDWTLEYDSRPPKTWELRSSHHHARNTASSLPCLGRRIINGEIQWDDTFIFDGEFHYIPGYWEWAEDILSRSRQTLKDAKIYDAVYGSLFTYDRNTNILQAFCEAWCPVTNTLLTSVGEASISLWDLHAIGGLPITGSLYEEVVPDVAELTTLDNGKRFLPQSYEHLFDAFHKLRVATKDASGVFVEQWVKFWCKKDIKYAQPPPRKEKKSVRLKASHNPTGKLDDHTDWSSTEGALFHKLEVKSHKVEETYLAAFLSCWLCTFVLPIGKGSFIRPGVFRMVCHMACGRKVSLAIPVLASIYRGLNTISKCSRLDTTRTNFPIHYVYGWLAYYFKTHYPLVNGPTDPLMATFSGEGAARYFEREDARKRIHGGGTIVWNATLINRPNAYHYRDDDTEKEYQSNFFMSIRSNYLPLRDGDVFLIDPYSPHRFSRQFGFFQDVPGRLDRDIREASLVDGLRHARICVLIKSMARATFPPNEFNLKRFFSINYKSWWEKTHGNFLESHAQSLANAVGLTTNVLQQPVRRVLVVNQPSALKSKVVPGKVKGPSHHTSLKRPSQDESITVKSDECWKRLRQPTDVLKDTSLHAVEVSDDNMSSSRTLTATKEANNINTLEASHPSKPRGGGESVEGPNSKKSSSTVKSKQEATSNSHGQIATNAELNSYAQPAMPVSVFNGRKVVSELRKNFVKEAWAKIRSKLVGLTAERASSLNDEVQVILEDIDKMGVDISHLKNLLDSFFGLATSYDQARSSLANKVEERENSKTYLKSKEHLDHILKEKIEKSKGLSIALQSLKEAKKKVKELKSFHVAIKKEVEDMESKVSTAEQEYTNVLMLP